MSVIPRRSEGGLDGLENNQQGLVTQLQELCAKVATTSNLLREQAGDTFMVMSCQRRKETFAQF